MSDNGPSMPSVPTPRPKRTALIAKRVGIGIGVLAVAFVIFLFGTGAGKDVRNLWANGSIGALLFPGGKRTYTADNEKNLKAIRVALMLYHDSEGQFPIAAGWMDAIQNRIDTSDMTGAEAAKKLIRPDLAGQDGKFGYALNDVASGKYKEDVGSKTILVYESKQTSRNAHGNPATDRVGIAITVGDTITK